MKQIHFYKLNAVRLLSSVVLKNVSYDQLLLFFWFCCRAFKHIILPQQMELSWDCRCSDFHSFLILFLSISFVCLFEEWTQVKKIPIFELQLAIIIIQLHYWSKMHTLILQCLWLYSMQDFFFALFAVCISAMNYPKSQFLFKRAM